MNEEPPLTVVVEREVAMPPDRVWRALTTPHLIAEWLMTPEGFAPVAGQPFRLRGDWVSLDCEVIAADPPRRLSYRWDHAHDDPAFALKSVVSFTLTPTPAGTRLRVEQVGFRPGQKQALAGATAGWRRNLEALERAAQAA